MKTHNQPIPLNPANTPSESRLVKTAALFTFRGLRALVDAAKTVPDRCTTPVRAEAACRDRDRPG